MEAQAAAEDMVEVTDANQLVATTEAEDFGDFEHESSARETNLDAAAENGASKDDDVHDAFASLVDQQRPAPTLLQPGTHSTEPNGDPQQALKPPSVDLNTMEAIPNGILSAQGQHEEKKDTTETETSWPSPPQEPSEGLLGEANSSSQTNLLTETTADISQPQIIIEPPDEAVQDDENEADSSPDTGHAPAPSQEEDSGFGEFTTLNITGHNADERPIGSSQPVVQDSDNPPVDAPANAEPYPASTQKDDIDVFGFFGEAVPPDTTVPAEAAATKNLPSPTETEEESPETEEDRAEQSEVVVENEVAEKNVISEFGSFDEAGPVKAVEGNGEDTKSAIVSSSQKQEEDVFGEFGSRDEISPKSSVLVEKTTGPETAADSSQRTDEANCTMLEGKWEGEGAGNDSSLPEAEVGPSEAGPEIASTSHIPQQNDFGEFGSFDEAFPKSSELVQTEAGTETAASDLSQAADEAATLAEARGEGDATAHDASSPVAEANSSQTGPEVASSLQVAEEDNFGEFDSFGGATPKPCELVEEKAVTETAFSDSYQVTDEACPSETMEGNGEDADVADASSTQVVKQDEFGEFGSFDESPPKSSEIVEEKTETAANDTSPSTDEMDGRAEEVGTATDATLKEDHADDFESFGEATFGNIESMSGKADGTGLATDLLPPAGEEDDFGDFGTFGEAIPDATEPLERKIEEQPAASATEADEFGEFASFAAVGSSEPVKGISQEENEPALTEPCEPSDAENALKQDEDDDDDFGEFGDFTSFEEAASPPAESPANENDSAAEDSAPSAHAKIAAGYEDICSVLEKAETVFSGAFSRYASDDNATGSEPSDQELEIVSVNYVLSSLPAGQEGGDPLWFIQKLSSVLLEVDKLGHGKPSVVVADDGSYPYANYAFPVGGLTPPEAGYNKGTEKRREVRRPSVPDVLSIELPTGKETVLRRETPEHMPDSRAEDLPREKSEGKPDTTATVVVLPNAVKAGNNHHNLKISDGGFGAGGTESMPEAGTTDPSDVKNDQISEAAKQLLEQIPDLSFMLESSLCLPEDTWQKQPSASRTSSVSNGEKNTKGNDFFGAFKS